MCVCVFQGGGISHTHNLFLVVISSKRKPVKGISPHCCARLSWCILVTFQHKTFRRSLIHDGPPQQVAPHVCFVRFSCRMPFMTQSHRASVSPPGSEEELCKPQHCLIGSRNVFRKRERTRNIRSSPAGKETVYSESEPTVRIPTWRKRRVVARRTVFSRVSRKQT